MICKNCNAQIDDDAQFCPVCNVFVNAYKTDTREIRTRATYVLMLDNGVKFDIQPDVNAKLTIGRADVTNQPDIDLGPYDGGPFISRLQGEFVDKDGILYYRSLGKNGTIINNKKLTAQDKEVKISAGDKITFVNIKAQILSSNDI